MNHTGTDEEARGQAALYALGALTQHEARSFEEHVREGCAACAAGLEEFGAVVRDLAWGAPEAAPPAGARERLLARVPGSGDGHAEASDSPAGDARSPAGASKSPAGADGFLIVRAGEGKWFETSDAGVSAKVLFFDRERETVTTLVRMEPGARIRAHRHRGTEQCLVLEGDLRSGGLSMGAGDFNCSLPGSVHQELTTDHGALFLIVAPERYDPVEPHA
jgi:anti-sigma factor ChrR (cupin superfamily)